MMICTCFVHLNYKLYRTCRYSLVLQGYYTRISSDTTRLMLTVHQNNSVCGKKLILYQLFWRTVLCSTNQRGGVVFRV